MGPGSLPAFRQLSRPSLAACILACYQQPLCSHGDFDGADCRLFLGPTDSLRLQSQPGSTLLVKH